MKHRGCPYRASVRGRSMTSRPGVGGPTFIASLTCSRCGAEGSRTCRADSTPHQLDGRFRHMGWSLDPHVCPTCTAKPREKTMASKPTPAAMKAQAQMFALLTAHFDSDKGVFTPPWSDAKVASETGLAVDHVVEFRRAGFGELKEPSEVGQLRDDINALDSLAKEQAGAIAQEVAALRGRLADLSKRWAA